MKKNAKPIQTLVNNDDDDMDIPEFDFNGATPNPFAEKYREGVAVTIFKSDGTKERYVLLDADVAEKLPSPKWVNDVLRQAIQSEAKKGSKKSQKQG